jgi:beta-aspartyl-peptidase (threonine type)
MFAIIVHGGAGTITEERISGAREGCRAARDAGAAILAAGGSALDAVEAAVRVLENDPRFNAGRGSCLNAEGKIRMDASICEGHSSRFGAVCDLPPFANPVSIARLVAEDGKHAMYAGEGAAAFARSKGVMPCEEESLITEGARAALQRYLADRQAAHSFTGGTVGAAALDTHGHLAAATSTGGMTGKSIGRVGDSPLPGAGTWADDYGAASATGHGEAILRALLTREAVGHLARGSLGKESARAAIEHMAARVAGGTAGIILVSRAGEAVFARNTLQMSYALRDGTGHEEDGV